MRHAIFAMLLSARASSVCNSFFGCVHQLALHHCCPVLMQQCRALVVALHIVSMTGCSNMLLACKEDGRL